MGLGIARLGVYFYIDVSRTSPWARFIGFYMGCNPEIVLGNWWASADDPLALFSWITVGCLGAWYALLHARLNLRLITRLNRIAERHETRYLPRHSDGQHGWAPFEKVFNLILIGSANFVLALVPIAYLLTRGSNSLTSSLLVLAVGLFGGFACLTLIVKTIGFVRKSFGSAWEKQAAQLDRVSKSGRKSSAMAARMDRAEMGAPGGFPLGGPWKRMVQAIAVATALAYAASISVLGSWVIRGIFG